MGVISHHDRRQQLRVDLRSEAVAAVGSREVKLQLRDLSVGGCRVATTWCPSRGERVSLVFHVDGSPIGAWAEVAWTTSMPVDGAGAYLWGLRFVDIEDGSRAQLAAYVEHCAEVDMLDEMLSGDDAPLSSGDTPVFEAGDVDEIPTRLFGLAALGSSDPAFFPGGSSGNESEATSEIDVDSTLTSEVPENHTVRVNLDEVYRRASAPPIEAADARLASPSAVDAGWDSPAVTHTVVASDVFWAGAVASPGVGIEPPPSVRPGTRRPSSVVAPAVEASPSALTLYPEVEREPVEYAKAIPFDAPQLEIEALAEPSDAFSLAESSEAFALAELAESSDAFALADLDDSQTRAGARRPSAAIAAAVMPAFDEVPATLEPVIDAPSMWPSEAAVSSAPSMWPSEAAVSSAPSMWPSEPVASAPSMWPSEPAWPQPAMELAVSPDATQVYSPDQFPFPAHAQAPWPTPEQPAAQQYNTHDPAAYGSNGHDPSAYGHDPSGYDVVTLDAAAAAPATYDPSAYDPSAYDPSAFDPSAFDPSALDPSSLDPASFDATVARGATPAAAPVAVAPTPMLEPVPRSSEELLDAKRKRIEELLSSVPRRTKDGGSNATAAPTKTNANPVASPTANKAKRGPEPAAATGLRKLYADAVRDMDDD